MVDFVTQADMDKMEELDQQRIDQKTQIDTNTTNVLDEQPIVGNAINTVTSETTTMENAVTTAQNQITDNANKITSYTNELSGYKNTISSGQVHGFTSYRFQMFGDCQMFYPLPIKFPSDALTQLTIKRGFEEDVTILESNGAKKCGVSVTISGIGSGTPAQPINTVFNIEEHSEFGDVCVCGINKKLWCKLNEEPPGYNHPDFGGCYLRGGIYYEIFVNSIVLLNDIETFLSAGDITSWTWGDYTANVINAFDIEDTFDPINQNNLEYNFLEGHKGIIFNATYGENAIYCGGYLGDTADPRGLTDIQSCIVSTGTYRGTFGHISSIRYQQGCTSNGETDNSVNCGGLYLTTYYAEVQRSIISTGLDSATIFNLGSVAVYLSSVSNGKNDICNSIGGLPVDEQDKIRKFVISSGTSSTISGRLLSNTYYQSSVSNGINDIGVQFGGGPSPNDTYIQKWIISTGNSASNQGRLSKARSRGAIASNLTSDIGMCVGGYNSTDLREIQKFVVSTALSAEMVGSLTEDLFGNIGTSNGEKDTMLSIAGICSTTSGDHTPKILQIIISSGTSAEHTGDLAKGTYNGTGTSNAG
ncbi:MAG: hypothetical protein GY804_09015 [Alphaproteobacteria bacterium]|nr:hypothetical protein [Alphaproteobacteria bacterium]